MIFCCFKSGRHRGDESFVQSALKISPWALAWVLKVAENKNNLTLSTVFRISLLVRKSVTLPKHAVFCNFQNSHKRSRRNPERWLDKTFVAPHFDHFWTCKISRKQSFFDDLAQPSISQFCQAFRKTFFSGFLMCVSTGTLRRHSNRFKLCYQKQFLFPYSFEKTVGKLAMKNARSIFWFKCRTDSGPSTTWPPHKICHDSPVLAHISESRNSGRCV
jgi:hypothetical protein